MTIREQIQNQAKELLIKHKDNGTLAIGMGLGKSLIAIDRIKEGNYKNILITGYRSPLKENWKKELNKWNIIEYFSSYSLKQEENFWINVCNNFTPFYVFPKIEITIENIQTAYRRSKEQIQEFDFIIADETQELFTQEYGQLFIKARELNIPVLGLSGTPDYKNKKDFYDKYCPILMEYYDVEGDITNEVKVYVFEYELSDEYKVLTGNKTKQWYVGEKKQYEYIEGVFNETKQIIENRYFSELKERCNKRLNPLETTINTPLLEENDFKFLQGSISKDLEYFYSVTKPRYESRDMSVNLYYALRDVKGWNYSILGTKAMDYLSSEDFPKELKPALAKYCWALKARKEFLWNLCSSATIARLLKNKILNNRTIVAPKPHKIASDFYLENKVLLFSQLTEQCNKLSQYRVHSKTGKTAKESERINAEILEKFNRGELREISSVKSLTTGVNLKGLNWIIVESFDSSDVKSWQIRGRNRRLELGETANMVIIVPKNTQSSSWFKSAFGDMEYKVITKLEDLNV